MSSLNKIKPAVSVIIPIYNVEKYLRQCLDSIATQTLTNIEIICINDGSTDNCLEILREYAKYDSRFIVVARENRGVGFSRNEGINTANGEFVIFMDPDDWYPHENNLLELYTKAKFNKALICGGSLSIYKNDNVQYLEYPYAFDNEGFMEFREYQYPCFFQKFLFDRNMLLENNIYFPQYKRFQDPPFMVRAMVAACKFFAVKSFVYRYRADNNKTINFTDDIIIDILKGYIECLIVSREHNLEKLHSFIGTLLIDNHYPIQKYLHSKNTKVHIAFMETLIETEPMIAGMDFVPYCLYCFFQKDVNFKVTSNNNTLDFVFMDALNIWLREINRKRPVSSNHNESNSIAETSSITELKDSQLDPVPLPIPSSSSTVAVHFWAVRFCKYLHYKDLIF